MKIKKGKDNKYRYGRKVVLQMPFLECWMYKTTGRLVVNNK